MSIEKLIEKTLDIELKEESREQGKKHPNVCYNILPSTSELIKINWGEKGYEKITDKDTGKPIVGDDAQIRMLAVNTELGVSEEEAEAMMIGSIWGWKSGVIAKIWGQVIYNK